MSQFQPQIKGSIGVGSSVGGAAGVTSLPVGADGTVLTADSAQPSGLKYAAVSGFQGPQGSQGFQGPQAATAGSARDAIVEARVVSGNADFFSVSSLTLTLLGATKSFVYNIGGTEYTISNDAITLAVTDTAHNFIYIDNAGALGRSALPCIYSFATPGAPVSGQHWYDLGDRQMKEYNGAVFVDVIRVFIGYVRADGGTIAARYVCEPIGLQPLDRWTLFGDGSDGFLDVSSGTTTIDGTKQYTAVVLRSTAVVNHSVPGGTTSTLFINAQGIVAVLGTSIVNLDGLGAPSHTSTGSSTVPGVAGNAGGLGGAGGGGGSGSNAAADGGAGGNHTRTQLPTITGGGAGATSDAAPGVTGEASVFPATPGIFSLFPWLCGADGGTGGGGTSTSGAGGGGCVVKAASVAVQSTASMTTNGNAGAGSTANVGGGGGGGGGVIVVWARVIVIDGTFTATGGTGGTTSGIASAGGVGGAGKTVQGRL